MLESTYDQIFEHAAFKRYPLNSSKNERRVIRRRGYEHFYSAEGVIYTTLQLAQQKDQNQSIPLIENGELSYVHVRKEKELLNLVILVTMVSISGFIYTIEFSRTLLFHIKKYNSFLFTLYRWTFWAR